MNRNLKRRLLLLISAPIAIWIVLRRPTAVFLILLAIYWNADRWLGVTPLSMQQLVEFLANNVEAAIAFSGLIIAFAAARGFVEAKQLDLKLALEAEITNIQGDAGKLIDACSYAVERMVKIKEQAIAPMRDTPAGTPISFVPSVHSDYRALKSISRTLPEAQRGFTHVIQRFSDIERKFGPIIRTSVVTTVALDQAKQALEAIGASATFMVPQDHLTLDEFVFLQARHTGASPSEFLAVVEQNSGRFYAWIGAASAIGAGSIFRPSAFNVFRMAWKLW